MVRLADPHRQAMRYQSRELFATPVRAPLPTPHYSIKTLQLGPLAVPILCFHARARPSPTDASGISHTTGRDRTGTVKRRRRLIGRRTWGPLVTDRQAELSAPRTLSMIGVPRLPSCPQAVLRCLPPMADRPLTDSGRRTRPSFHPLAFRGAHLDFRDEDGHSDRGSSLRSSCGAFHLQADRHGAHLDPWAHRPAARAAWTGRPSSRSRAGGMPGNWQC